MAQPAQLTPGDKDIAKRTLYGEARGESFRGKVAVAHVLLNRRRREGLTLAQVCLRPKQFSCWNKGDPNLPKLQTVDRRNPAFQECAAALSQALREQEAGVDPTGGARHYHAKGTRPWWSIGRKPSLVEGGHVFYRGIA